MGGGMNAMANMQQQQQQHQHQMNNPLGMMGAGGMGGLGNNNNNSSDPQQQLQQMQMQNQLQQMQQHQQNQAAQAASTQQSPMEAFVTSAQQQLNALQNNVGLGNAMNANMGGGMNAMANMQQQQQQLQQQGMGMGAMGLNGMNAGMNMTQSFAVGAMGGLNLNGLAQDPMQQLQQMQTMGAMAGMGGVGQQGIVGTEEGGDFKRKLRLEQNRLSAQRSRKRKKILIEELQKATQSLEDEHRQLEDEHRRLTNEYERRKRIQNSTVSTPANIGQQGLGQSQDSGDDSVTSVPAPTALPTMDLTTKNTSPVGTDQDSSFGMEKIHFSHNFPKPVASPDGPFKSAVPASEVMAGKSGEDKLGDKLGEGKLLGGEGIDVFSKKMGGGIIPNQDALLKKLSASVVDNNNNNNGQSAEQQRSATLQNIAAQLASFGHSRSNSSPNSSNSNHQPQQDADAAAPAPSSGIEGLARAIAAQRQNAFLQAKQAQARQMIEKAPGKMGGGGEMIQKTAMAPMPGSLAAFRETLLQHQMKMNDNAGGGGNMAPI
uniref:BZIP domain-containing protein n=1 Tax=Odontella aurita TaxID=265563 RepID=A0A7S4MZJ5_9STRA